LKILKKKLYSQYEYCKKITEKIDHIEKGNPFTYKDLNIKKEEYPAASKSIERLIKKKSSNKFQQEYFINRNKQFSENYNLMKKK